MYNQHANAATGQRELHGSDYGPQALQNQASQTLIRLPRSLKCRQTRVASETRAHRRSAAIRRKSGSKDRFIAARAQRRPDSAHLLIPLYSSFQDRQHRRRKTSDRFGVPEKQKSVPGIARELGGIG